MKRIFALVLVFALCLSLAGCGIKSQAVTFRSGKVLAVTGEAVVLRGSMQMPVYQGMVIQGGDRITTKAGAQVDLRLDDDKYLVALENTVLRFELDGNRQRGYIRIHLEQGTVSHDIENPLSQEDSYEVHTAEAVMAVRGTEFDTSRENGETHIQVEEGTVNVNPNNPDEPDRDLNAGDEARVGGEPPRFLDGDEGGEPPAEDSPEQPQEPEDRVLCEACAQPLAQGETHYRACGHYSCTGDNHSDEKLPCGHFPCIGGYHVAKSCGHWHCWGSGHDKLSCGHYECHYCDCSAAPPDAHVHVYMECGVHTCCDDAGSDHRQCTCLGYLCDGGAHDSLDCRNWDEPEYLG